MDRGKHGLFRAVNNDNLNEKKDVSRKIEAVVMVICDMEERAQTSSAEALAMARSSPGFSWWHLQWRRARVCWRDGGALNLSQWTREWAVKI